MKDVSISSLLMVHILILGTCRSPVVVECAFSFPRESSRKHNSDIKADSSSSTSPLRSRHFWELVSSSSSSSSDNNIPVQNRSSFDSPPATLPAHISLETRLQKLEHHFNTLKIFNEDCRQRLLCNLAENPKKFAPLSTALLEETSYVGDEKMLASVLLPTIEGARLLTYIEASQKGLSRVGCEGWTYRCPVSIMSMIDYKSLLIWKEWSKWLTVKFVAKKST